MENPVDKAGTAAFKIDVSVLWEDAEKLGSGRKRWGRITGCYLKALKQGAGFKRKQ
jgi:hypothetical protein